MNNGTQETLSIVEAKMPKIVKKRRKLEETEEQTGVAWAADVRADDV